MDPHCNTYSEEVPVVDVVRIVEEEGQVLTYDDSGSEHGSTSNIATGNGTVYNLRAQNCETLTVGPVTNFHGHVTINVASHDGIGIGPKPVKEKNLYDRKAGAAPAAPPPGVKVKCSRPGKNKLALFFGAVLLVAVVISTSALVKMLHRSGTVPDRSTTTEEDSTSTVTSTTSTVTTTTPATTPNEEPPEEIRYISKHSWGGRPALNQTSLKLPVTLAVVKHTAGWFCSEFQRCAKILQDIQSMHVTDGAPDIWYNFLIGGDGNIYEGRGWSAENEHTKNGIDIAYIGNYTKDEVSIRMDTAGQKIIFDGLMNNHIGYGFKVVNHNQTKRTLSPGQNVFKVVVKWPGYSPIVYLHPSIN